MTEATREYGVIGLGEGRIGSFLREYAEAPCN